jgi:hypothetical protein
MTGSSRASLHHRGPVRESLVARRRRRARRVLIGYAAAAVTVYVGAWHLAHHPSFAVQAVEVEGNTVSSDEAVAAAARAAMASSALSLLPMTNAYLSRAGVVEEAVAAALPEAAAAVVSRQGQDLVVRVEERARFGYWCRSEGGDCFAVDPEGLIFARENPPEGATRFGGLIAAADPIRERYAPNDTWANLRVILEAARGKGFSPVKVTSQDGIDFKIELAEGPYLLTDATHEGAQAVENLQIALDDESLSALRGYEYADLRLPHKVFLKALREEAAAEPVSEEAES